MHAIRTAVEDNLRSMRADVCRYRDILKIAGGVPAARQRMLALEMFQRRLKAIMLVIRRHASKLPAGNANALRELEKHTKARIADLKARTVTENALETLIWLEGILFRVAKNLVPVINPSGID